jgi:hypothetical protein
MDVHGHHPVRRRRPRLGARAAYSRAAYSRAALFPDRVAAVTSLAHAAESRGPSGTRSGAVPSEQRADPTA